MLQVKNLDSLISLPPELFEELLYVLPCMVDSSTECTPRLLKTKHWQSSASSPSILCLKVVEKTKILFRSSIDDQLPGGISNTDPFVFK